MQSRFGNTDFAVLRSTESVPDVAGAAVFTCSELKKDILVDANQRDSLQSQDSPVTFLTFLKCELSKTQ